MRSREERRQQNIPQGLTEEHKDVLQTVANQIMIAAQNARLLMEAQRHAENAAAEAAGRAAALEPLALNPDGTIEEPILAESSGKIKAG